MGQWEAVIGLEVHVQLATRSKNQTVRLARLTLVFLAPYPYSMLKRCAWP